MLLDGLKNVWMWHVPWVLLWYSPALEAAGTFETATTVSHRALPFLKPGGCLLRYCPQLHHCRGWYLELWLWIAMCRRACVGIGHYPIFTFGTSCLPYRACAVPSLCHFYCACSVPPTQHAFYNFFPPHEACTSSNTLLCTDKPLAPCCLTVTRQDGHITSPAPEANCEYPLCDLHSYTLVVCWIIGTEGTVLQALPAPYQPTALG